MTTEPRRIDFSDVHLYAVSPAQADDVSLLERIDHLLAGGVDAVQLRCRNFTDRQLLEVAKKIKERCSKAGVLFIMNNRVDVALAANADGVHIGHSDLPVPFVRELIGHRRILGVSAHSVPEALAAQKAGADYVSCGPLWATPTKPDYPAVGTGLVGLYNAALKIPFVAIGGIDLQNVDQVLDAGATRIAVVRGLFDVDSPAEAAQRFRAKLSARLPKPV